MRGVPLSGTVCTLGATAAMIRGMRRTTVVSLLAVVAAFAALPAAASAASLGARVLWPKGTTWSPASPLHVGVVPRARGRAVAVTVTVASGDRVLAKRTLRRGALDVPLGCDPAPVTVTVRSALGQASRTFQGRASSFPPQATLTLSATQAFAGDRFLATLTNTGRTCITDGYPFDIERRTADGGWERPATSDEQSFILPAFTIPPGSSHTLPVHAWRDLPPGRYRIVKEVGWTATGPVTATAEFDVVAPPG